MKKRSLAKETEYYLHGVICHEGKTYKGGHYFCFLLEMYNDQIHYHLLDDDSHDTVSEEAFKKSVEADGYIYLYSKEKFGTYNLQPYTEHETGFCSLKNDVTHFFRVRQPPRSKKKSRDSEVGTRENLCSQYMTLSNRPATRMRKTQILYNEKNKKQKLIKTPLQKSSSNHVTDTMIDHKGEIYHFHSFRQMHQLFLNKRSF